MRNSCMLQLVMGICALDISQEGRLYQEVIYPLYDPLKKAPDDIGAFLLEIYPVTSLDSPEFVTEALTDALTSLPFKEDDLIDIAKQIGVEDAALANLNKVKDLTDEHVDALFQQLPSETKQDMDFLAVCMILKDEAHENSFRATGRPYDMHPLESAAILHFAKTKLIEKGYSIDETLWDLATGVTLVHDIVEEGIGKEGMYFDFSRNRNYHSLLFKRVIEKSHEPIANLATEGAMSLEHITHVKSRPWMREYSEDYISGRVCQKVVTILAKASEMTHNDSIEPHPEKPTNIKYVRSMPIMETALIEHLAADGQNWGHDFFEIISSIKREDIPSLVRNLREYIYEPDLLVA